jgi:uncharacterized protein
MRRCVLPILVIGLALALTAPAAFAHSELEPGEAAPGSIIDLQVSVENEQSDAGTTSVQLFFPESVPVVLAELPPATGWETTIEGGAVGAAVTSVTWSRPTASPDDDPVLPVRLGPLPTEPQRLQFKLLQTYSNGEVDRWIADWPQGAPEPDNPGPVLDLVVGAPGEIPTDTTAATTGTTSTVETAAPPTTADGDDVAAPTATEDDDDDGDDSNTGVAIGIIVVVVLAAGGLGYAIMRRRR